MKQEQKSSKFNRNRTAYLENIIELDDTAFRKKVLLLLKTRRRLIALFAMPDRRKIVKIYIIIADDAKSELQIFSFRPVNNAFKSFTPELPQFHLFEREIYEQNGIMPLGHPCIKPVRFERVTKKTKYNDIGEMDYFRIDSNEIHQVAVGPVHAGIIEPGHFRFQCHGEIVHHLEISLGYQHRGIEKQLVGGPYKTTPHQIEAVAGDSSIAHSIAYCRVLERLTETTILANSQKIRGIALELERCANHIGDLGAMAGDIGYLPTMSYCGRIRGDFLNITALLCGNRFGRGLIRPGGVTCTMDIDLIQELRKRIAIGKKDFTSATALLWESYSVLARFEGTGVVTRETAQKLGMVGVAARASGVISDARINHSTGIYRKLKLKLITADSGDVFARARVRWFEVIESIHFIDKLLLELELGADKVVVPDNMQPETICLALEEGWRGEVCHIGVTNEHGKFQKYKIIDPSFHNWYGLAVALRGEQISDFPLCNKSFNLSYCGFDL
jgi:Ni,Fe-hydrogenase III large subunit